MKISSIAAWFLTAAVTVTACVPGLMPMPVQATTTTTKSSVVKWPTPGRINSKCAVLMDVDTGTVLYSKNPDKQKYPASITKVMTALLALENSNLSDEVVFSEEAVYKNEGNTSHIARQVNEKMTMEQTLYGMMLESANECAWAIAETVGGTEPNFIRMMNDKAKELGCTNTHFNNPNGLPDPKHKTTAMDMARIARAAYKNPDFAKIVGTKSYQIPKTNKHKTKTPLNNHHCMLNYYHTSRYLYKYCMGGKTGYTTKANSTLVTYAKKGDTTLACVVLDAHNPDHYIDTTNLFEWGFKNFKNVKVSELRDFSQSNVFTDNNGLGHNLSLVEPAENATIIIPRNASSDDVTMEVTPSSSKDNKVVGLLCFSYGKKKIGTVQLKSTEKESDSYPFHNVKKESEKDYIQINPLFIILVVVGAATALCLLFFGIRKLSETISTTRRDRYSARKGQQTYRKIRRNDRRR
jgi:D-alanyl-D-alanine carboxypeptidase